MESPIQSIHNCARCYQRVFADINFGQVTKWVCQGCGIVDGPLKQLSAGELEQIAEDLRTRRIIICHGSLDPPINDPEWLTAETLDNDPAKRPTYNVSISDQWPQANPL